MVSREGVGFAGGEKSGIGTWFCKGKLHHSRGSEGGTEFVIIRSYVAMDAGDRLL